MSPKQKWSEGRIIFGADIICIGVGVGVTLS